MCYNIVKEGARKPHTERGITMSTRIYFDMDGTLADFYGQSDWLERLRKPGDIWNEP